MLSGQLMELSKRFLNEVLEPTFHLCSQYKKAHETQHLVLYGISNEKKNTSGNKGSSFERIAHK